MNSTCSVLMDLDEQSQIGAARRAAAAIGYACELDDDAIARLSLVVTEAATNVVRHAGSGLIILRALTAGVVPAVEVLAIDKGPGINNLEWAMRDGFSTAGTAGQGLGAMKRLADVFEMYSQRGLGTVVLARVRQRFVAPTAQQRRSSIEDHVGVISVPLRGQEACGDAWRIVVGHRRTAMMLVDGLGHGPDAEEVAQIAITLFPKLASGSAEGALDACDKAMRGSRGAALSVAMIDAVERNVRFAGVGNVDARVLADGQKPFHLIPQNGIVGHAMPTTKSTMAAWPHAARIIMHSDGISTRWRVDAYDGLAEAHPAIVAGVIFRDFARRRDDATVLVFSDQAWGARQ